MCINICINITIMGSVASCSQVAGPFCPLERVGHVRASVVADASECAAVVPLSEASSKDPAASIGSLLQSGSVASCSEVAWRFCPLEGAGSVQASDVFGGP